MWGYSNCELHASLSHRKAVKVLSLGSSVALASSRCGTSASRGLRRALRAKLAWQWWELRLCLQSARFANAHEVSGVCHLMALPPQTDFVRTGSQSHTTTATQAHHPGRPVRESFGQERHHRTTQMATSGGYFSPAVGNGACSDLC